MLGLRVCGGRETPRPKRTKELTVSYMDEGDEDDPDIDSSDEYKNDDEELEESSDEEFRISIDSTP